MAAISIPKPGTKYGPCEDIKCIHSDCQRTREMINNKCEICRYKIGYDTRFYMSLSDRGREIYKHAMCAEMLIEGSTLPMVRLSAKKEFKNE